MYTLQKKMEWRILDARFIQPKLKNYTWLSNDFVCLFAEWSGCCWDSQRSCSNLDAGAQKRVSLLLKNITARVGKQAKFIVCSIFIAWNRVLKFSFLELDQKRSLTCSWNQLRQMRISLYSRNILSLCKWLCFGVLWTNCDQYGKNVEI